MDAVITNALNEYCTLKRVSWSFGCPGHGKGTWDGLGGIVKNYVLRQIIITSEADIPTVESITQMTIGHFCGASYKGKKISKWSFYVLSAATVDSLRKDLAITQTALQPIHAASGLGIRKIFFFEFSGKRELVVVSVNGRCFCRLQRLRR